MSRPLLKRDKNFIHDRVFMEPMSGCWLWEKAIDNNGYGRVSKREDMIGLAHRLSYSIFNGSIPKGACVLHRCDTPGCTNPKHLFLGTIADNNRDMADKGRAVGGSLCGVDHGMVKLSEEDICNIRGRFAAGGHTIADLSVEYGMHRCSIARIISGALWAGHQAPTSKIPPAVGAAYGRSPLTDDVVAEIRAKHKSGELDIKAIAENNGVSVPTIYDIIHKRTWKHVVAGGA